MPCHAMPCHAMPCHAMLCYAMLCHAMPRWTSRLEYSLDPNTSLVMAQDRRQDNRQDSRQDNRTIDEAKLHTLS